MSDIKFPSVLAFERKLEPSDALMYSGSWQDINDDKAWHPISLFERRNRAVKSNFKPEVLKDEKKLQEAVAEPNLSWGDDAALLHEHDTLKVSFSMRVLSGCETPSVCNQQDFEKELNKKILEYFQDNDQELAARYAHNLANGRFLWRNRIDAQNIQVIVNSNSLAKPITFDAYDYSLRKTRTENDTKINQLAELIKLGLKGSESIVLQVSAYVQIGKGQRVWPSQEMVMGLPKGSKSRHLFSLNEVAAIHSEKIGNALRTIDDWYPDFDTEDSAPIAIEAYGSVTQRGIAYRSKRGSDFVSLIRKWVIEDKSLTADEQHFVVAMLIRGGVFGESDKD